eukprot:IDg8873t1
MLRASSGCTPRVLRALDSSVLSGCAKGLFGSNFPEPRTTTRAAFYACEEGAIVFFNKFYSGDYLAFIMMQLNKRSQILSNSKRNALMQRREILEMGLIVCRRPLATCLTS